MVDKEKLQEKYLEFQMLSQQLQQLQQNIESLEKHIVDLSTLKESLDNISKVKPGEESLMPLGNGVFIKGEIKETQNVIMNVGSDVFVERTVVEAIETVEKQLGEVNILFTNMQEEALQTHSKITEIQEEFQKLKEEE